VDIELLKYGRHFRLDSGAKVVVGRNEEENSVLDGLARPDDVICKPVEVMGPVLLLRAKKQTKKDMEIAARISARFSDTPEGKPVKMTCADKVVSVKPYTDEDIAPWRIRYIESKPEPKPAPEPPAKKGK